MTRPIVIDVIGRDRTGAAMKSAAESQKNLARQIDATNKGSDNLRKSQLGLIVAQERYNKVAQNTGSSVGQLASAQKGLITAQQRVAAETRKATTETEKFGNTANRAYTKFTPLVDSIALLGPALIPIGAAAVAAGAGLAGLGAAGVLAFKGIQREMKQGTTLGKQYQDTFAPVVDEFHQLEHIAAANVFGGINKGAAQARTLFPLVNQDVALLSTRLGSIAGNVGAGVVALFHDLNPLFLSMANALSEGAGAFQRWATTSDAPKKFVAYAQAQLPKVEALFRAVATAVVHIGEAAAPIGAVLLPALSGIASAIAKIPTPVLTAMIVAFEVSRLQNIAGGLTAVSGALRAIGISAGVANPIILGVTILLGAWAIATGKSAEQQAKLSQATNDVTAALQASNGVFNTTVRNQLAKTAADTGALKSLDALGLSQSQYIDSLTQGKDAQNDEIQRIAERAKALGLSKAATIQLLGPLTQQVNSVQDGTDKWKAEADAIANASTSMDAATRAAMAQQTFLDKNNLTVETATKKYNDAVTAAHTFTAELGYMSKALDTLSNNQINATLQQDQLNLTMGTSADNFAGARKQVEEHGTALKGNTDNAISNRDWALQQIQAINQQAVSYAQATGSIDKGTGALGTNIEALKRSMRQAGFTEGEIQNLIDTYAATPSEVSTSVKQQGAEAVLQALGDIEFQLHAIADPVWKANLDIASGATAAQGGKPSATGGYISGPGGPTSDVIPLMASNGEYIVNARSTARHRALLENINRNKFAGGGLVGDLNVDVSKGAWADMAAFVQSVKNAMIPPAPPAGAAAPGNISGLQAYAYSLFPSYGWGAGALSSLISLWNGESGWNPAAYNASSGATGIPQALPASKMASAGADYLTNGATQIRWGLGYIAERYGSPTNAYSFWLSQSPHWYGRGLAPTVFSRPTLIGVGESGPETVSVSSGRYGGAGVVVAPGAITVYAAPGMDAKAVARQAFAELRRWVADEERKAAKGGRA